MVQAILDCETKNDFIQIRIRDIEIINKMSEYHGVRVNLIGQIEKTRTSFSIDFGVGDVIFPCAVKRTLPVLLQGFEQASINTYTLESTISEKFDAIIRFMEANGRMKDFFDIYTLAITYSFEGSIIKEALHQTISNRETAFGIDSARVLERLIENENIRNRWKIFCQKVIRYDLDFEFVIHVIVTLIDPLLQAIVLHRNFDLKWNPSIRQYE